jgi:nitroreductase
LELYEAMKTLRAVRRLRPDPIPDDVLNRVLEAATWAPSGANLQPWRIVVVKDRGLMKLLGVLYADRWHAYSKRHAERTANAPEPMRGKIERTLAAGDSLAEHFADTPALLVFCFNPDQMAITDSEQDRVSVVGGGSVYPAVQNVLLACRNEGLGCVLTTLLCQDEPQVRALLEIPEGWYTAAAIPVGYPQARGHGPITRKPVEALAYADRFGAALT